MLHVASIAMNRGDDLSHPGFLNHAPVGFRLADLGKLEPARRREAQSLALRGEPGRIANRRHLYARFGAVDKAVEHLRVDRGAISDLQVFVENLPDGVGRGTVIMRLVARPLAGCDPLESTRARPI